MARERSIEGEHSLPLALAEELVQSASPEDAAPLLTYYAELVAPRVRGHVDENRLHGTQLAIEAELNLARGNRMRAEREFVAAFNLFKKIGFLRRAAIIAYRLTVLTNDERYRRFIDTVLADVNDAYWVKSCIAQSRMDTRLSGRHIAVLKLIAEGKTNKEIAAARGLAFFTARNMVRELLALFGVRTRGQLAALAVSRGIVSRPDIKS
jgi:DNA-binding CsgD family transcriptional regulator